MKTLIKILIMVADIMWDVIHEKPVDREKASKINQVIYSVCGAKLDYGRKPGKDEDLERYLQEACAQRGLELPGMSASPSLD